MLSVRLVIDKYTFDKSLVLLDWEPNHQDEEEKAWDTLLPTQGIFNLLHHIDMVWEELVFDGTVSYTQQGNELQHS